MASGLWDHAGNTPSFNLSFTKIIERKLQGFQSIIVGFQLIIVGFQFDVYVGTIFLYFPKNIKNK